MFILGLKYKISEMTLNIEVPEQKLIDKSEKACRAYDDALHKGER